MSHLESKALESDSEELPLQITSYLGDKTSHINNQRQ